MKAYLRLEIELGEMEYTSELSRDLMQACLDGISRRYPSLTNDIQVTTNWEPRPRSPLYSCDGLPKL